MCGLRSLLLLLSLYSLRGLCQVLSGLQCFRLGPDSDMNCTWTVEGENGTDIVYTLHYRSLKYVSSQLSAVQYTVPHGQTWGLIARKNLTAYDRCQVKVEGITADGRSTSQSREMDVNAIVVQTPPKLSVEPEPSLEYGNVMVSWEPSATSYDQPPLQCELQYREKGINEWSKVIADGSSGFEILDLAPFTLYEVRGRYLSAERNQFGSDWSELFTFCSPESAPEGKVDVWRSVRHGGSSLLVMWKPLPPSAARCQSLNYSVNYRERNRSWHVQRLVPCCNISLPGNVDYVSISASNLFGQTEPSNISMQLSDLPAPAQLQVLTVNGSGLNVSWKPVERLDEELQEYLVEWRLAEWPDPEIVHWRRLAASQGLDSILLTGDTFQAEMPYNISVYALYSSGFGGPNSRLVYIKEGVPLRGPPVVVHGLSSNTALVTLGELPLLERRGIIMHYTVYITRGETKTVLKKQNFSGQNVTISGLEPSTQYQLHVTASTSAGESPTVNFPFLTPGEPHESVMTYVLVTTCLLTLCLLGMLFQRWICTLGHFVIPKFCWQKIPDPLHSKLVLQVPNGKNIGEWSGFIVNIPDIPGELEDPPITEVEEMAESLPDPPASVNLHRPEQDEDTDQKLTQSSATNPEWCDPTKTSQSEPTLEKWRPPIMSGYERHFMPSPEDLGLYT